MTTPKSKCCDAPLRVSADVGTTRYYICSECLHAADPKPEADVPGLLRELAKCQAECDRAHRELDAVIGTTTLPMASKLARARQKEIEDLTAELAGTKACLTLLLDALVQGAGRLKAWQACAGNLRTHLGVVYTDGDYWENREHALAEYELLKGDS